MGLLLVQGYFMFEVIDEQKKTVSIMRTPEYVQLEGKLIIPSEVTYKGEKYSVVKIGGEYCHSKDADFRIVSDNRYKTGYRREMISSGSSAEYGFEKCNITEVVVPECVTEIGKNAFAFCHKLVKVKLPGKLEVLGNCAFKNSGLTSITVPGTVKSIGYGAFEDSKIKNLTIKNGVEKIGARAFYHTKITKISIPASVNFIGYDAFETITLTKAIIDDSGGMIRVDRDPFPYGCKVLLKSKLGFFERLFQ